MFSNYPVVRLLQQYSQEKKMSVECGTNDKIAGVCPRNATKQSGYHASTTIYM
jgi:hypothetical protein